MGTYKDLLAYQKGFSLAMRVFELSKSFPGEERFSLTDQIRRSTRSVCANLAESFRRRRYKDFFTSKLNDAETENTESQVWLDFAVACGYIEHEMYIELSKANDEVGKLIWYMISNPDKFR